MTPPGVRGVWGRAPAGHPRACGGKVSAQKKRGPSSASEGGHCRNTPAFAGGSVRALGIFSAWIQCYRSKQTI